MSLLSRALFVLTVSLVFAPAALAQGASKVSWSKDLTAAFAEAKGQKKILMICVNAKYVDGKKTEESANKGLREVVYKDARFVAKSREFVCVLFTPGSKKSEFGELRALGIHGDIVSPQHIFVHPGGSEILLRKEYWSHGKGEPAVTALLALMDKAQKKLAGEGDEPEAAAPEAPAAPTGDERAGWIRDRISEVVAGTSKARQRTIDLLIRSDKKHDCTTPLILLLTEHRKNTELLVDLIRGLGRDQLVDAAAPIAALLTHRKAAVRGNAAVSLEYIGDRHKDVVAALRSAAGKEKDESIANHMYRALGRCGVEDSKARSLLLKKCAGAKSEFASYGPAIGLAYFKRDSKAARGVEKILKRIGVPGGRRAGGQNTVKRSVLCWTLAWIGDPKTSAFMKDEQIAKLKNIKAFWVAGLRSFYLRIARKCEGTGSIADIEGYIRGVVAYVNNERLGRYGAEGRSLMDEYRKDRNAEDFRPKGHYLLGGGRDT